MIMDATLRAAIDAYNDARIACGGIKTDEQQRFAMNQALDAAERTRKAIEVGEDVAYSYPPESAAVSIETGVAEEIARIRQLFVRNGCDSEDIVTYASEVARLRLSAYSAKEEAAKIAPHNH